MLAQRGPDDRVPVRGERREAGVLGAVAGIIGSWQAMEAIKLITGAGSITIGRTMNLDGLYGEMFSTSL